MGNTYNSNRLQFVHCDTLFTTREEAKAYVGSQLISIDRPALYAEPMVLKYGNEEEPNILLAIGSVGDGETKSSSNRLFFIDIANINESIDEILDVLETMGGDIADLQKFIRNIIEACGINENGEYESDNVEIIKAAKSLKEADTLLAKAIIRNTIQVEDTNSVNLSLDVTDNGSTIKGDVVVAPSKVVDNQVCDNIILSDNNGLFSHVNVSYANDVLYVNINGEVKEYQLPTEVYLKSGSYNKKNESLELVLTNDTKVIVPVGELIDEWDVEKVASSPVNLSKTHVTYSADTHGNELYHDILSADIRLAEEAEEPYNILKRDQVRNSYIYVDGRASNITYFNKDKEAISVQEAIDSIKCEASKHDGNIVSVKEDGVFANVEITYNEATNVLTFNNGINNGVDIQLNSAQIIRDINYDAGRGVIVIDTELTDGTDKVIEVPIEGIVNSFEIDNTNNTVKLVRISDGAQYYLSANVNVSKRDDNIIEVDNDTIYVKGTADNIKYNEQYTVDGIISLLNGDAETAGSVRNLLKVESDTRASIDQAFLNALNEAIEARKAGDLTNLTLLQEEVSERQKQAQNIEAEIATETQTRKNEDTVLTEKINTLEVNVNNSINRTSETILSQVELVKTNLENDITTLDTKVNTLNDQVNNKVDNLEATLNHNIEDVTTTLSSKIDNVDNKVMNEIAVVNATLTTALQTEAEARAKADNDTSLVIAQINAKQDELEAQIDNVDNGLTIETTRAISAETALETAIQGLVNETHDLTQTLGTLNDKIDNEIDRSIDKDNELSNRMTVEEIRAISAETALQYAIDGVNAKTDNNANTIADLANQVENKLNKFTVNDTYSIKSILSDDVLKSELIVNQSLGNIIKVNENGVYAQVTIDFDPLTSTLTFNNGNGAQSFTIAPDSLVTDLEYNDQGQLVMTVKLANGVEKEVVVEIDKIVGGSTNDSPIIVNVSQADQGIRTITADLNISEAEGNLLKKGPALYASDNAAYHIGTYRGKESTMQEILGVIQDEIDIAVSQERLTAAEARIEDLEGRVAALEEFIRTQLMDFGTYLPNVTNE